MRYWGKKCFETKDDIPLTDDPQMDNRPIAVFELFHIHEWLELGQRYNSRIQAATEIVEHEAPKR